MRPRSQQGQASVELVAGVPAVLLLGALAWQLALVGHAAWLSAHAARTAARAEVVGRDGESAARSVLPSSLERGLRVREDGDGAVRVRVRVPLLLRSRHTAATVGAAARLGSPP